MLVIIVNLSGEILSGEIKNVKADNATCFCFPPVAMETQHCV